MSNVYSPSITTIRTGNKQSFTIEKADRKYLLYIVDLFLVQVAISAYCSAIEPHLSLPELIEQYPAWFLAGVIIWSFYAYVFDMYNLERISKFYNTLQFIVLATTLTVVTYLLFPWYTPKLPDSRIDILFFCFNTFSGLVIWRYLYLRLLVKPLFLKRIVIIGSGWSTKSLIDVFAKGDIFSYHLGYKVVGVVNLEANNITYKGVRNIQNTENLTKLFRRLKVDEIVVDGMSQHDDNIQSLRYLTKCRMKGINVVALSDFYEDLTGRVLINDQGKDFSLAFPYNKNDYRRLYLTFSRALDVAFGVIGVAICSLFIPFVYLANMFGSKGPLFYSQERVGLYGKTFKITKFRSMVVDAEKDGAAWAQKNDARITSVGKFLRRSRIDELPQAWSVLIGDMSLIGPRPERPVFVEQLKQEIPFYDTRHLTKPGITGWAQAIYKYGSNTNDALMKVQYDLYYLKNRSILLDIKVLLKTISVVVKFKGM